MKKLVTAKSPLQQHLIQGASGTLGLNIANIALNLLLAVFLARILEVENFGIYAFCLSVMQTLTGIAMLGGNHLLVREVAAYRAKGDFHFLRGILRYLGQAGFLASLILGLGAAGIGIWCYRDSPILAPFLLAAALVPFFVGIYLLEAAIRGLRYVFCGQALLTLQPVLVLALIGILFGYADLAPSPEMAMGAQLAGSVVLLALGFFLLHRVLPKESKTVEPEYETVRWIKSMVPFVFAGGMQILNNETSVVLLGVLRSSEDVGIFRVSQRCSMLISFGLLAVNIAIGPTVSELFAKRDQERLQRLVSKSLLAVLAFALPVTLVLVFGGKWLIQLIFGLEYVSAYVPLIILCIGQLINAGIGSVGLILNMAGLERFTARGMAVAGVASVVLNGALIPYFGTIGAAIATSTSLVIWNLLLFMWLYRETGIWSTIRLRT